MFNGLVPTGSRGGGVRRQEQNLPTSQLGGKDGALTIPWNDGKPPSTMMESWVRNGEFDIPSHISAEKVYQEYAKAEAADATAFLMKHHVAALRKKLDAGMDTYKAQVDHAIHVVDKMRELGAIDQRWGKQVLKATVSWNTQREGARGFREAIQGDRTQNTGWRSLRGR